MGTRVGTRRRRNSGEVEGAERSLRRQLIRCERRRSAKSSATLLRDRGCSHQISPAERRLVMPIPFSEPVVAPSRLHPRRKSKRPGSRPSPRQASPARTRTRPGFSSRRTWPVLAARFREPCRRCHPARSGQPCAARKRAISRRGCSTLHTSTPLEAPAGLDAVASCAGIAFAADRKHHANGNVPPAPKHACVVLRCASQRAALRRSLRRDCASPSIEAGAARSSRYRRRGGCASSRSARPTGMCCASAGIFELAASHSFSDSFAGDGPSCRSMKATTRSPRR